MDPNIQSLNTKFRKITIIPLILFGIITLFTSSFLIYTSMRDETEDGLSNLAHAMSSICELSGDGDYYIIGDILYKGSQPFDLDYAIVDTIKKTSGVDATIFWQQERISTTIRNKKGERILHSSASQQVQNIVLGQGKEYFSDNVFVNEVPYFGHYIPLKNHDDTIIGMIFVGKPRTKVLNTIYRSIAVNSSILVLMTILVSFISLSFSGRIVSSLKCIKEFLGKMTKGDIDSTLDRKILKRDDEIGEMGNFSVMLQKNVTQLINKDALTGLYNRRCAAMFLENAIKDFHDKGKVFTVAIGDIDDFKKINDTYGHNIGDEVLKHISSIFLRHCEDGDIVARWGGEEFLFLFRYGKEDALKRLNIIQNEIRHMLCESSTNCEVRVTMTFGVSEYHQDTTLEMILKDADNKLYLGKGSGKNKVI